jgi:hypothetical protein
MNTAASSVAHLSDRQLLTHVAQLADRERRVTAQLIAALIELDTRRLYLAEGCSSLFTYCTQVLHLSAHAAYGRITAARAAHRFPAILGLLADGAITLTTIGLLAPHLTRENHGALLEHARHKSKREVEHQIAALQPRPAVPSTIRRLPPARPPAPPPVSADLPLTRADVPAPPPRPAIVAPIAPERYTVQFTIGRETYEKLQRARDLLRHVVPDGNPAAVFDRALTTLLKELSRSRLGADAPGRHPSTALHRSSRRRSLSPRPLRPALRMRRRRFARV